MDLLKRCREQEWRRLAFIGIAKHAGKTTALNGFLHQLAEAGQTVGLLSVGVDGERLDTILGVPKPRVYVEAGTIVASAERALMDSEAHFEWLQELPISSPLGSVMIARVTTPGTVVLAGVRQRMHVRQVTQALMQLGCEYVLVDGAFDRVAAATPDLVDAAVLAVGAVVGRTVEDVARHAQPVIARFQLPEASPIWKQLFAEAREAGLAALALDPEMSYHAGEVAQATETGTAAAFADGKFDVLQLPAHAVMFDLTRQMGWSDDTVAVYIPGALTDGVVDGLLRHPRELEIVVNHPVQVLISGAAHRRLLRHGHQISVWNPLPLAGIAVNPHHITGFDLPAVELLSAIQQIAHDIPVYDALAASTGSLEAGEGS